MGDFKSKPFPHHCMPGCSKLLVHCLLDHLGCLLWLMDRRGQKKSEREGERERERETEREREREREEMRTQEGRKWRRRKGQKE